MLLVPVFILCCYRLNFRSPLSADNIELVRVFYLCMKEVHYWRPDYITGTGLEAFEKQSLRPLLLPRCPRTMKRWYHQRNPKITYTSHKRFTKTPQKCCEAGIMQFSTSLTSPVYIKIDMNLFLGCCLCIYVLNFDPLTVCFHFLKVDWNILVA